MEAITKRSIKEAFQKNKKGRLILVYTYYRDVFFNGDSLPAHYIAERISADLNFKINPHSIYDIKEKYEGKLGNKKSSVSIKQEAGEKEKTGEKSNDVEDKDGDFKRKEFTFSDPDYKDNHIDKAFDEWHERQKKKKQKEAND